MNKYRASFSRAALAVLLVAGLGAAPAEAGTAVSTYGVDDGLGLNLNSGDAFFPFDLAVGDGVAEWHTNGSSVALASVWSGQLQSASLEVFSGGWGLDQAAQVFLNNQLVGTLTVGDGSATATGETLAFRDVFNLDGFLSAFNGVQSVIEIRTSVQCTGDPQTDPTECDEGALGFLKLTLVSADANGGGNTVPEPASVALAGVALASALLARRRRRD